MREAMLYERMDELRVHCFLCAHHCKISPSNFGICGVRKNIDGNLFTYAYGEVVAENVDPIEKKPLYHFLPGSFSYSVAAMGCNFKCGFCQNWQISQIPDDINFNRAKIEMPPFRIVENAKRKNCKSISFTYSEPTIFFEYAYETARIAREQGIYTVFVTNGYMTEQAIEMIGPYLNACNVDLKAFSNEFYKKNCKARLEPVLDSIIKIKKAGIWLEITTLIIPGENDSEEELERIAEFISELGSETPWHISRFFPNYEFINHKPTPVETILKAQKIGKKHGLKFIYPGNIPHETAETKCFNCKKVLIRRTGFQVNENNLKENRCDTCNTEIPGIWK